ncbi:MAG: DoxX family protein [Nanoarchaeota archaeon]
MNYKDITYFIFRVFVGLLFFQHGAQKLFGWFGGNTVELLSLFGIAGIIETIIGPLIALGLFTRFLAFIGAFEMAIAYFNIHLPQGFFPIINQGELALLYFASFLILINNDSGKWSLDSILFKKKK